LPQAGGDHCKKGAALQRDPSFNYEMAARGPIGPVLVSWRLERFHYSGQSHFVTFCCYLPSTIGRYRFHRTSLSNYEKINL
jgi:hypothetical protein